MTLPGSRHFFCSTWIIPAAKPAVPGLGLQGPRCRDDVRRVVPVLRRGTGQDRGGRPGRAPGGPPRGHARQRAILPSRSTHLGSADQDPPRPFAQLTQRALAGHPVARASAADESPACRSRAQPVRASACAAVMASARSPRYSSPANGARSRTLETRPAHNRSRADNNTSSRQVDRRYPAGARRRESNIFTTRRLQVGLVTSVLSNQSAKSRLPLEGWRCV